MALCYRLFRGKYPAADATGAFLAGGRWNAKGVRVLYASTTLSLACLEILVHIKEPRLPIDYAWVSMEVANEQMDEPLSDGDFSDPELCRQLGSAWVQKSSHAVIAVPSIIIPTERNLLLNPQHPEFRGIQFSEPTPFRFDPRLLKLGPAPV